MISEVRPTECYVYITLPGKTEAVTAGRTYQTTTMKGVFGALRDAGPDYWGRRVIERHVGKPEIGEMDYLLYAPDDRAGALGFGLGKTPPAPRRKFNQTLDLEKLQTNSRCHC